MNKEALLAVADVIEYNQERFDIYNWARTKGTYAGMDAEQPSTLWENCNTSGCIAGWTCAWADVKIDGGIAYDEYPEKAREELGLTKKEADQLFYPDSKFWVFAAAPRYDLDVEEGRDWGVGAMVDEHQITGVVAADVLRSLADGSLTFVDEE